MLPFEKADKDADAAGLCFLEGCAYPRVNAPSSPPAGVANLTQISPQQRITRIKSQSGKYAFFETCRLAKIVELID